MKHYYSILLCFFVFVVQGQTRELVNEYFIKGQEAKKNKDWVTAAISFEKASEAEKNNLKPRQVDLYQMLALAAIYHKKSGNYEKSESLYREAIKIANGVVGKEDKFYGFMARSLADLYERKDMHKEALPLRIADLEGTEKRLGKSHSEYLLRSKSLSDLYNKLGKYDKVIELYIAELDIIKRTKGTRYDYRAKLSDLGALYQKLGQYDKALSVSLEEAEIKKQLYGVNHQYYVISLLNLSNIYKAKGVHNKAIVLLEKSLEILKIGQMNTLPVYGVVLNNLASIYEELGQYEKALPLYKESLKEIESISGKNDERYNIGMTNLAGLYLKMGNVFNAILYYNMVEEYYNNQLFVNQSSLVNLYNNLGYLFRVQGNYEQALSYYSKSLSRTKKEHADYFNTLNNIAELYERMGRYDEALHSYLEAVDKAEDILGPNHLEYGNIISNLASFYITTQEFEKVPSLVGKANTILWENLNSVFSFSSTQERKQYLKNLSYSFSNYQAYDYLTKWQYPELNEVNINNQYLLKGLLLKGYSNIIDDLSKVKDSEVIDLISNYRGIHTRLATQKTLPEKDRFYKMDSLEMLLEQDEKRLVAYHTKFFKERSLIIDWKKVRDKINSNEIIVEFSHFNDYNYDSRTNKVHYMAYIFSKKDSLPKTVFLFNENDLKKELDQKSPQQLYNMRGSKAKSKRANTSKALYNFIWKPIEAYFKDKETIYFAPSGLLNQLALAALPDGDGELLLSKYNLFQMSNTANLAQNKLEIQQSPAVFAGGIQYDFIPQETKEGNYNLETIAQQAHKTRSNQESFWQFLPGTEQEANELHNLYKRESKNSTAVKGELATEEWFKSLSGNSPKVLHLATHGFFFENESDTSSVNVKKPEYTLAKDPLLRGGLVLAHGNYTWHYGKNPFKKEDGILTAYEISRLDFRNTDLVVLSACETGLGDIDGSEGVYGLQRAFKMAGVDIIVMSLWEVPDKETAEFMKLFYSNWLGGMKVREAFNTTQRTMSAKYKDFPEKWAAFVLFE